MAYRDGHLRLYYRSCVVVEMSDLPYIQLWPRDYLADTRHLTTEQHGAYILLIMEAWMRPSCSLPDDDELLSRLCVMTPTQWKKNKSAVLAFWSLDKRRKEWVQKRLKEERKKATSKKQKASDSAASRWKQKKKGDANAMRTQCSPDSREHKDTNVSFNAQGAKKKNSFVKVRTSVDAAQALIERKGISDGRSRASEDGAITGDDVQLISSIGGR